jgi:hypothetical protein
MNPHVFDSLTRLVSAPRSRRAAWRALLGAALLGATTRTAAAAPTSLCDGDKHDPCGSGRDNCCPGKCFVHEDCTDEFFCCTGPKWIICGEETTNPTPGEPRREPTCCENTKDGDPCGNCIQPPVSETCITGITGSYRRR